MILEWLDRLVVPIVLALIGAGALGARTVARRTEPASSTAPPLPSPPPPGAQPQTEVEAWLFEQMKLMIPEQADMRERLNALEDSGPLVKWWHAGAHPPPPRPSERLLRAFGLHHDPETHS